MSSSKGRKGASDFRMVAYGMIVLGKVLEAIFPYLERPYLECVAGAVHSRLVSISASHTALAN